MLAKNAIPGNTFPPSRSKNDHRSVRISGFDLTHIIELSPLPKSVTRVLKFACNLAGSTSEFMIVKSLRNLAEEAGCSISTVQRAYREAVKLGILNYEAQRDEKNINVSKPSKYTFTSKALAFVRTSLEALKAANLQPSGRQSIVRKIIANAFFKNNFIHAPPGQNEQASPGQTDQQEVISDLRKRETLNGVPAISELEKPDDGPLVPVKKTGIYQQTHKLLAAASAKAQNERRAQAFELRGSLIHEAYQVLRSSFTAKAAAGGKQKSRRYVDSLSGDCVNMDYAIPEGFRG